MNRSESFVLLALFFINTIGSAQSFVDWKHQVVQYVNVASTPNIPTHYNWIEESILGQGVHINLNPTEVVDVYLEHNNSQISFGHFISNSSVSHLIVSLEVNVNNTGYVQLYQGSPKQNHVWDSSPFFSLIGNQNLKVRYVTAISTAVYQREYNIQVVPKSDKLFRDQYGNTIRLWRGSNTTSPSPILLSPGFDAYNTKPEQYYRYAGRELFDCLLNNGFDVYVMYYKYNPQDLRNNAAVYASGIQYISTHHNNSQNIISAGISMGGLISRYALAKAEDVGLPLPVSKWISLDAPHQGAYISIDLQIYLGGVNPLLPQPSSFDRYANDNPAAKTLLIWNFYEQPPSIPNGRGQTFNSFFNELNSLNGTGYPTLTDNIGVSFSTTQPNNIWGKWLEIDPKTFSLLFYKTVDIELYEKSAGSFLPKINIDPFIFSLYGTFWTEVKIKQFQNPTFISHNSSLDISAGFSPFDEVIIPDYTRFHDEIPSEVVPEILEALLRDVDYRQNAIVTSDLHVKAGESIYSGNSVTNQMFPGDFVVSPNVKTLFQAGVDIDLSPGFSATYQSDFESRIDASFNCGMFSKTELISSVLSEERNAIYDEVEESDESFKAMNLRIFPNPVTDILFIESSRRFKDNIQVSIYSISGRLVLSKSFNNCSSHKLELNIGSLSPGLFLCQIKNGDILGYAKLIKE